ncbi:Potassium voltage-gated channel subfamily H member 7 [Fasciola gigantica]|uniref:Potassium voltage-gated channel subfamily H member 7 n=1 Tax=Fasciola gigantica TaxID=46835 RepID=A0A504YCU3_FASGI|nr:Potassium voltage-gated channel subfamily H member 7 [Fasciola gigantica]
MSPAHSLFTKYVLQYYIQQLESGSIKLRCHSLWREIHSSTSFIVSLFALGRKFLIANAVLPQTPIIFCNDDLCHLCGYSRAEILQRSAALEFLYGPLTSSKAIGELKRTLTECEERLILAILYDKSGTHFVCQIAVAPVRNAEGQVRLYILTFRAASDFNVTKNSIQESYKGVPSTWASQLPRLLGLTRILTLIGQRQRSSTSSSNAASGVLDDSDESTIAEGIRHPLTIHTDRSPGKRHSSAEVHANVLAEKSRSADSRDAITSRGPLSVVSTPSSGIRRPSETSKRARRFFLSKTNSMYIGSPFNFRLDSNVEHGAGGIVINMESGGQSKRNVSDKVAEMLSLGPDVNPEQKFQAPRIHPFTLKHYGPVKAVWDWLVLVLVIYTAIFTPFTAAFLLQEAKLRRRYHMATLIGLLKTARLLRLVRVVRKLDRYSEYGAAVLLLLMATFVLIAHWLACIWYAVGNIERQQFDVRIGWLDQLAAQLRVPFGNRSDSGPCTKSKYVTALYFTFSSLTSVGFGNVSPNTNPEKIFSICVMLVGSLMYAGIFGHVSAIIQRLYSGTARYHAQMLRVKEFIRFHQIPNPLKRRLEEFFQHAWSYTNGIDMNLVLRSFPECLQADICLHLNRNLLSTCPPFKGTFAFLDRLCAPYRDTLVHKGDVLCFVCFIARGSIEILMGSDIVAVLCQGDVFGESPFGRYLMGQSKYYVRALTYCDLHKIQQDDLLEILEMYPEFAKQFRRELEITFDLRSVSPLHFPRSQLFSPKRSPHFPGCVCFYFCSYFYSLCLAAFHRLRPPPHPELVYFAV